VPAHARSALNHCNLPAQILGSLTYQAGPVPLLIDGVRELHRALFRALDGILDPRLRGVHFQDYMRSGFLLDHQELAGFDPDRQRIRRGKADYLRLLRGWMFDSDSIEGAVLKRWVESRFGLLPRSHRGALGDYESLSYQQYQADYLRGLYNTNALEAQLDLLYSFCQYELQRRDPVSSHYTLYRGVNRIECYEELQRDSERDRVLLLNNLNSFSSDRLHSCTFGDQVMRVQVPLTKLLCFHDLLPGVLQGEHEYLVIGGLYRVELSG